MSELLVKGNALGTGRLILESPDTNDDITLQFPGQSGMVATVNNNGMPVTSDGTPVVESGSNSDGSWTKFGDGTLLAMSNLLVLDCDMAEGSVYRTSPSDRVPWTYPVALTETSYAVPIVNDPRSWGAIYVPTLTEVDVGALSTFSSTASLQARVSLSGRWK